MKKIITIVIVMSILGILFFATTQKNQNQNITESVIQTPSPLPLNNLRIQSKSIFVPYWVSYETLETKDYDRVIYFGIKPSRNGINREEEGYRELQSFVSAAEGKEKLLTVRMIDEDVNLFVLENEDLQRKIINETLDIVNEYLFDGVVLDLEIHDPFNTDTTIEINEFVQLFYSEAHKHYRKFLVTIYGDTFFRKRPYDISFLGKNSDEIMIMTYDFHKSRGEPGPNFPLLGRAKWGYDIEKMHEDFLQFIPQEKITVIFGMFGYDWLVDEKKRPIRPAKALSLNEIRSKFLKKGCHEESCVIRRDDLSSETEINYVISAKTPDDLGVYRIDYHIVWFEDQESVKLKTEYLRENGIGNIAFWAYNYF